MKRYLVIILATTAMTADLFSAEAGMPQLDPKYWASQAFWLVIIFASLYLIISKIFLPKIKNSINTRDSKIKDDLDESKKLNEISEKKQREYMLLIDDTKKEVQKIILENKNKLTIDISAKKKLFEKEIDLEIEKAQKEILNLKNNSVLDIEKISKGIASKIIEEISGDKLNESSIEATISDISKKDINKYL